MDLKVISGGLSAADEYRFFSGEVTDTRLMGVLGLHMHWVKPEEEPDKRDLHLLFYYDVEELGLESVTTYVGRDKMELDICLRTMFGGLGAEMKRLSERESRWLAMTMVSETKKRHLPLPEAIKSLDFLFCSPVILSVEEKNRLFDKMACPIATDYGVVNYYLMRLFGKDPAGAAWLVREDLQVVDMGLIEPKNHCTFLRNSITPFTDEKGRRSYLSETLVEVDKDNAHMIVVTDVEVQKGKVVAAKKLKEFRVTEFEASMRVSRPEFVTVYEIMSDWDRFDSEFERFVLGATKNGHETGDMYMEFKPDNSHVDQPEFSLSDDVQTLYFVSDFGQLVVGAYTERAILRAETLLSYGPLSSFLLVTGRYQFADPILFDFAQSGFEDFHEFLKSLQ